MADEIKKYDMTLSAADIDAALLVAKNAVTYEPQTVPPEKQAQARANMGIDLLPIIEIHPEIDSLTESGYVGRIPVTESAKLAAAVVQKLPVIVKSFLNGLPAGSYVLNLTACDEDIIYYEFETSYYNANDNVHIVLKISSPQGTMEGEWAFAAVISTQTDSLGDIDAALDAILAIQNELIGGDAP